MARRVFFSSETFRLFFRETHFRKVLHFCTFVFNYVALILHLQVSALPASVPMARPAKSSQKLNINTLDLRVRIFDSDSSSNVRHGY